jgi:hypothetical protein
MTTRVEVIHEGEIRGARRTLFSRGDHRHHTGASWVPRRFREIASYRHRPTFEAEKYYITTRPAAVVVGYPRHLSFTNSLEGTFDHLARSWREETAISSSLSDIIAHPAYQRIIGLGPNVVPLILRELRIRLDHWFWALSAITGYSPGGVEPGDLRQLREAWLAWGRAQGLLKTEPEELAAVSARSQDRIASRGSRKFAADIALEA